MQAGEQEGEQPGVGDRCVTVTTDYNRSIDIAVLSHVNIIFYRHLSYDTKDSNIIFGGNITVQTAESMVVRSSMRH
jgi:hypothetical protein